MYWLWKYKIKIVWNENSNCFIQISQQIPVSPGFQSTPPNILEHCLNGCSSVSMSYSFTDMLLSIFSFFNSPDSAASLSLWLILIHCIYSLAFLSPADSVASLSCIWPLFLASVDSTASLSLWLILIRCTEPYLLSPGSCIHCSLASLPSVDSAASLSLWLILIHCSLASLSTADSVAQ